MYLSNVYIFHINICNIHFIINYLCATMNSRKWFYIINTINYSIFQDLMTNLIVEYNVRKTFLNNLHIMQMHNLHAIVEQIIKLIQKVSWQRKHIRSLASSSPSPSIFWLIHLFNIKTLSSSFFSFLYIFALSVTRENFCGT